MSKKSTRNKVQRQKINATKARKERRQNGGKIKPNQNYGIGYDLRKPSSNLNDELVKKMRNGYEIWSSCYQAESGEAIPFLFIADRDLPRAGQYLNDHRAEVYSLIEHAFPLFKKSFGDTEASAIIYTNPSNGEQYGISLVDDESAVTVAKEFGLGEEFEGLVNVTRMFSSSAIFLNIAA